jgi:hypothetical protein
MLSRPGLYHGVSITRTGAQKLGKPKEEVNVPNPNILHLDAHEVLYELNILLRIFGQILEGFCSSNIGLPTFQFHILDLHTRWAGSQPYPDL